MCSEPSHWPDTGSAGSRGSVCWRDCITPVHILLLLTLSWKKSFGWKFHEISHRNRKTIVQTSLIETFLIMCRRTSALSLSVWIVFLSLFSYLNYWITMTVESTWHRTCSWSWVSSLWRFHCRMIKDHREGVPDPHCPGQYAHVEVFDNLTTSSTHGRQWRGCCTSFCHRLHGTVGMVSYPHVSMLHVISVICLV